MPDKVKLLDHGYCELIETWGSDQRIIESARMSTDKGFLGWGPKHADDCPNARGPVTRDPKSCGCVIQAGDEKLLRYLYEHAHNTPFEFAGLTIEVQAPIVVFREWHRHRTMSYNEMSGRYTVLPDLYYVPDIVRITAGRQSKANKQGSAGEIAPEIAVQIGARFIETFRECRSAYEWMIDMGLSRELARGVLPVFQYSRMRATANLRNWLAFLTLRMDKAAQYEIRQYAITVGSFIAKAFPKTWALFSEANHA